MGVSMGEGEEHDAMELLHQKQKKGEALMFASRGRVAQELVEEKGGGDDYFFLSPYYYRGLQNNVEVAMWQVVQL